MLSNYHKENREVCAWRRNKYVCFMLLLYGHFYWKQSQQHSNHIFHCESSMCHWKQHQALCREKNKAGRLQNRQLRVENTISRGIS